MNALANSFVFWAALALGLLALYILPSVIAAIRHVEGIGWIIVLNLLPTGVGWIAALVAALGLPKRHAQHVPALPLPATPRSAEYPEVRAFE